MALIHYLQTARARVPTSSYWEMEEPRRLIPVQCHCQTLPTAIYGRGTQHFSDMGLSIGWIFPGTTLQPSNFGSRQDGHEGDDI